MSPREEIEKLRPRSKPLNRFQFGGQIITTKVKMLAPKDAPVEVVDITAAMHQPALGQNILEEMLLEI